MIAFLETAGLPTFLAQGITALFSASILIGFVAFSALFFIWLERKVAARIQDRLGPTRVGGRFGWLQTVADGIKLLTKEDLIPESADPFLFRLGPYLAFGGVFLAFLALPFAEGWVAYPISISLFFMLAVMSTEIFGVLLAGIGSGSKWALFGGIREAAQVVSYEIPMAISVLIPVILAGSIDLTLITRQQSGLFWNWNLFHDPFTFSAFWIYLVSSLASCKRAPFDLPEAESELVAGFHTEYSGLRWSFFFMAEYGAMFAVSGIATHLFLGGWHTGLPAAPFILPGWLAGLFELFVFLLKSWFLVFVMMWVRWSLPRLRIDQVLVTCLKYLLPISFFLFSGVCLWQVFVMPWIGPLFRVPFAILCISLAALTLVRMILRPSDPYYKTLHR